MPDPFVDPDVAEWMGQQAQQPAAGQLADDVDPDVARWMAEDELGAAQDDALKLIFQHSLQQNPDRRAGVIRIAEATGAPLETIDAAYDQIRGGWEASQKDHKQFRQKFPELAGLMLARPETGPLLAQDDALQGLPDELREGAIVVKPEPRGLLRQAAEAEPTGFELHSMDPAERCAEAMARAQQLAADPAAAAAAKAPTTRPAQMVPMKVDPLAFETGAARAAIFPASIARGLRQNEVNAVNARIALNTILGLDTYELEKQRLEVERKLGPQPYYGDLNALEQAMVDSGNVMASQLEPLAGRVGSAALAAGGAAGATALAKATPLGRFIPWSPAQAGKAAAKVAGRVGGISASFRQEFGASFGEFRRARTDAGAELPPEVAAGGAVVYAAIASVLEDESSKVFLQGLGPIGDLVATGEKRAFVDFLLRNPSRWGAMREAGQRIAKSVASEGGEEFSQSAVQGLVSWLISSKTAGEWQETDLRGGIGRGLDEASAAALGVAATGPVQLALNTVQYEVTRQRVWDAQRQVEAVQRAIPKSRTAKASPEVFAQAIEAQTEAASGAPLKAMYVDPTAITRLFQGSGKDLEAAATELMGEEGPKRLVKAVQTGELLEVPVAEWAGKWAAKPLAQELVAGGDVAGAAHLLTARQLQDQDAAIEEEAKQIVERAKKGEATPAETEAEAGFIERMEQDLLGSKIGGRHFTVEQAQLQIAVWRSFVRTQARRANMPLDKVLGMFEVSIRNATASEAEAARPGSSLALERLFMGMDDDARRRAFYTDFNTGLYNERGWDASEAPADRPMVAEFDLESKKFLNDKHGHKAFDGGLRAMAKALSAAGVKDGAKHGGAVYAAVRDQKHAAELAAAMEREIGGGFRVTFALGERKATIGETVAGIDPVHKKFKDEERNGRRLGHRKGFPAALAPAGSPAINWDWDEKDPATQAPELGLRPDSPEAQALVQQAVEASAPTAARVAESTGAADTPITEAHLRALGGKDLREVAETIFIEAETGLLTLDGFERQPLAAAYASMDLRALRDFDAALGHQDTNKLIAIFGRTIAKFGGSRWAAARLHGDEYAALAPEGKTKKQLEAWMQALVEECAKVVLFKQDASGDLVVVRGLQFAWGVDDDFETADRSDLPRRKAEAGQARGPILYRRGDPRIRGVVADLQAGGAVDLGSELLSRGDFGQALGGLPGKPASQGSAASDRVARAAQSAVAEVAAEARRVQLPPGAKRLRQDDDGPSGPRGWTDVLEKGAKRLLSIVLNRPADLSTVLHESAHAYLHMMGDLAALPEAPQQYRDDHQKLLAWLGGKSVETLTTEQHEAFARAWEGYLLEGKAPTAELRTPFARFKGWLVRVYKSATRELLKKDLNDETRAVFDRMLATDAELEEAKQRSGLKPMWRSPADAGMTAAEWAAYLEAQTLASSHAEKAGRLAELRAQLKENKAAASEREDWYRRVAKQEYAKHPATRFLGFLSTGKVADEKGVVAPELAAVGKLSREEVSAILGRHQTEGLEEVASAQFGGRKTALWRKAGEDGPAPDDVAMLLGYPTGKAMLLDASGHGAEAAWVQEQVDGKLAEEAERESAEERQRLEADVQRELHSDATAAWLFAEFRALHRKGGGANGSLPLHLEAIKRGAKQIAAETQLGALSPTRVLAQERRAADEAIEAAAKGDFVRALIAKQRQILNSYLYREILEAVKQQEQVEKLASTLSKDDARAKLGKASPAYRIGADLIVQAIVFNRDRNGEPLPAPQGSWEGTVSQLEQDGISVLFDNERVGELIQKRLIWESLSVKDAREVLGALKQIRAAAQAAHRVLVEGELVDRETVVQDLLFEASQSLPSKGAAPNEANLTLLQTGARFAAGIDGDLLRPSTMLAWLGGGSDHEDSMWMKAIFAPLQKAKHREHEIMEEAIAPIVKAMESIPKAVRARMSEDIDGAALFPDHRRDIEPPKKRWELLMLALNSGNASNLERLLEGRQISELQLNMVLGELTREEWDWVQTVWDAADGLWPMVADMEERVSGLRPESIEAKPVETKWGTYRGGYFPAVYERATWTGERASVNAAADLLDKHFIPPATPHSHVKKRVEPFSDAIALNPKLIAAHFAQVAHDLAHREAIRSVAKILLDERIDGILKKHLGQEKSRVFLDWVQDIGTDRGAIVSAQGAGWTNRLLDRMKGNFAVATLGYAWDIALGDVGNLVVAQAFVSPKRVAAGLGEWLAHPWKVREWALEKSGELRFRKKGLADELRAQMAQVVARNPIARNRLKRWWVDHAFTFMEWTDAATATPIWIAAYREALGKGKADADAVKHAEYVLQRTFPAHSKVDQSAALRDRRLGALLLFYGYWNTVYNLQRDIAHTVARDVRQAEGAAETARTVAASGGKAAAQLLAIGIGAYVIGDIAVGQGPGEDEDNIDWLTRRLTLGHLNTLPFGVGSVAERLATGKKISARAAPAMALIDRIGSVAAKWANDEATDEELAFELAKAATVAAGQPGARPLRALQYLTSDEASSDPRELIPGVFFGPEKQRR